MSAPGRPASYDGMASSRSAGYRLLENPWISEPMDFPPTDRWNVETHLTLMRGGHRNVAFRTVGLQRELVFKSTRRSPDAIEWLIPVHDFAETCGFAVPRLIRSKRGMIVESGWTSEPLIEGSPFGITDLPSIRANILRFHRLTKEIAQRPGFLSSQDLLNFNAGGDIDLASMPSNIVLKCREAWRHLSPGSCTVIHGDLNPGNLLRCADGRAALLDWDECRRDLPLFGHWPNRATRPCRTKGHHGMGSCLFMATRTCLR